MKELYIASDKDMCDELTGFFKEHFDKVFVTDFCDTYEVEGKLVREAWYVVYIEHGDDVYTKYYVDIGDTIYIKRGAVYFKEEIV